MASIGPVDLEIFKGAQSPDGALVRASYVVSATVDDITSGRNYLEFVQLVRVGHQIGQPGLEHVVEPARRRQGQARIARMAKCEYPMRHNSDMDHVDVDGMRIAYRRAGTGPVLVMLHGAPTDSRTWQWMLPDLARDHTVIAWDAPGFGESSDIDDGWRAPQFAGALAAFVTALGLERPHIVGHSFGTMVALSLFRHHPEVPASLVLVGGYAGWAGSLPPEDVARRLKMFLGIAELGDAFDPKSYPGLFSELISPDREAVLAAMIRENIRPPTVRAAGYIGAETDLRPVLPTVDVPTLVLHGAADARSPLANAEALHAAISTSQLVVLPGLGHACVVEDPETCAAEIRRFVTTVS